MLIVSLIACQKQNKTAAELTFNLSGDLDSIDPHKVRLIREISMSYHLFEGLMRVNKMGLVEPALAHTYEKLSPTHYRFHLRESVWSDATPLTAQEFENGWKEALKKETAAPLVNLLYIVKNGKSVYDGALPSDALGIRALDDLTLDVELEKPAPFFLELLSLPLFFPKKGTLTNGPYCLKKWKLEDELLLSKNPFYWNASAIQIENIKFSMIGDATTEYSLFEKKQLDWLGQPLSHEIPPEELSALAKKDLVNHLQIDGTFWVVCNTSKPPLDDKRLRQALSLSIDREAIIVHLLGGSQLPASSPVPPSMSLYQQQKTYDVEKAQLALEEYINEMGVLPSLTLNYVPKERVKRIAQILKEQWRQTLGLEVELEVMEKQLLNAKERNGGCCMSLGEWFCDFHHPYAILSLFEEPNGHLNFAKWDDPKFRSFLEQGLNELDEKKQLEHFANAEGRIVQQLPVIPIYHHSFDYVKESALEDIVLSPQGCIDLSHASLRR